MIMFYKKGIDVTNAKSMFNFLNGHKTYDTMSSWNGLKSIANNVKLHNLNLSGDWSVALDLLRADDYDTVNMFIEDWEIEHPGYKVGFNGHSDGYLVLYNDNNNGNALPSYIADYDNYEDFKYDITEYYGSVKNYMSELVKYTRLVQEFDKLCDSLRNYVDELSKRSFEEIELEKIVEEFNFQYEDDLETLNIDPIELSEDGKEIILGKVSNLKSLKEALLEIADRREYGYNTEITEANTLTLASRY